MTKYPVSLKSQSERIGIKIIHMQNDVIRRISKVSINIHHVQEKYFIVFLFFAHLAPCFRSFQSFSDLEVWCRVCEILTPSWRLRWHKRIRSQASRRWNAVVSSIEACSSSFSSLSTSIWAYTWTDSRLEISGSSRTLPSSEGYDSPARTEASPREWHTTAAPRAASSTCTNSRCRLCNGCGNSPRCRRHPMNSWRIPCTRHTLLRKSAFWEQDRLRSHVTTEDHTNCSPPPAKRIILQYIIV